MANAFNLTAQLNLQGPANIKPVVNKIKSQLASASQIDVKLKLSGGAEKSVENVTTKLKAMNTVLAQSQSSVGKLNASFAAMSRSLSQTGSNATKLKTGFKQIGRDAEQLNAGLKNATNGM